MAAGAYLGRRRRGSDAEPAQARKEIGQGRAKYKEMPRLRRYRWFIAPAVGVLVVAVTIMTTTMAVVHLHTSVPAASTPPTLAPGATPTPPGGTEPTGGVGLGPWTGADAVVAPPASLVQSTASALSVTASTPGLFSMGAISGAGPESSPASSGRVYTFSASVRATTVSRPAQVVVAFFSAAGSALGTAWGQLTPDATGQWTQTTPVVGIAPVGTSYLKLGVLFYAPGQGETHLMRASSVSSRTPGTSDVVGPLHTSGRTVADAAGQPVILRGLVSEWLDGNDSTSPASLLDDNSVAKLKQWGANTIRLMLNESSWSPTECAYSPGYADTVDQVVRSITSRGMVALLSLHNNGRARCGRSAQQRMADAPGSISFWTSVADRFKDNPLVAFDLYNEPHDITWDQWLDGGSLTDPDGVRWQAAGMHQLYDAVRGTGASNLVFISGNDWANTAPPNRDLIAGTNIVYAVHGYTCPTSPPPTCTAPDAYAAPGNLAGWSSLARSLPVVITEFGWPDPASGTYNHSVVNWAQAHAVGWMVYAWAPGHPAGPTTPQFGLVVDPTAAEPEASGMPVLGALSASP